jgi:hypothetical protein
MTASSVLMIEPKNFISNPQTVGDNFFQASQADNSVAEINMIASVEFQALRKKLEEAGIEVQVYRQEDNLETPDAIYPNNWFSTHSNGTLIIYPMLAPNRRLERRADILQKLKKKYPLHIDLSPNENKYTFLEGTGSLVIDHENKIVYASLSERTSSNLLFEWSRLMHHELVLFTSYDAPDKLIYHTNVMMCLADKFAIVCLDAIPSLDEKRQVRSKLEETNYQIIDISLAQMHHFCANSLQLQNKEGAKYLVMSDKAFTNFTHEQLKTIQNFSNIIHSDLSTIEKYGGGGARCMLAELF